MPLRASACPLQLIGHGEEHEWIDLATVRGYKRIVACQVRRRGGAAALASSPRCPTVADSRGIPPPPGAGHTR